MTAASRPARRRRSTAADEPTLVLRRPSDLDRAAVVALADRTVRVALHPDLVATVDAARDQALAALADGRRVYGVTTGMGAQSEVRLDAAARAVHQDELMAGRAVGSAPWLGRRQSRALLAVRLRTLLAPEAAASSALARRLIALLDADLLPAIPARGGGAAGEIIPLAHAGAALLGHGEFLGPDGHAVPAGLALGPFGFGPKEGVAFLQGVPGLTGGAAVLAADVRTLLDQAVDALAVSSAVVGASPDPEHPALGRADPELAAVLATLRATRGATDGPGRALQAPVSFRAGPVAVAVAVRAVGALEAAVDRALDGVTDSPAFLDGRFVGTAGFAGTDLVAALDAVGAALLTVAELGASRVHRMLDDRVTGLTRQLAGRAGRDAGLVAVHKRAVGTVHRLRRFTGPTSAGPVETSLGQEDVQSFGFEALEAAGEVLAGVREVVAVELLAGLRARALGAALPPVPSATLDGITARLDPSTTTDRPYGQDLDRILAALGRTTGHERRRDRSTIDSPPPPSP